MTIRYGNVIQQWLFEAAKYEASDLHLVCGYKPVVRLHGHLMPMADEVLDGEHFQDALLELLPEQLHKSFESSRNIDFAIELEQDSRTTRFRANYFFAADQIGACFRVIPDHIPSLDWAGFPSDLARRLIGFRNGLVIICGITGSGKTTTLAMLIRLLCNSGGYRIVTIEEPIEYTFPKDSTSVVSQREVGRDISGFDEGLKYSLRQDPDVILVGEIRDRDTAQTALRAAETGHLVFTTLHTRDAKGAISRYADLFPQENQPEIRTQLSNSLRAVISQHLLPNALEREKRVLALEVMFNNSPVAVAIRGGRLDSLDNAILTGRAEGMYTLSESVRRLYQDSMIDLSVAQQYVGDQTFLLK